MFLNIETIQSNFRYAITTVRDQQLSLRMYV